MSTDDFLDRTPGRTYNCFDFVQEVWLRMTGEDVRNKMTKLIGDFKNRRWTASGMKQFKRLTEPSHPCFVVMQRKRTTPHVGIWFEGRVLHLTATGVEWQPLQVARRYFTDIRYYR